jgi:transcriptional regulator with XRE-family HTH domain
MDLGHRVRDLRNAQHLNQGELAARASIARNTLNRIENGHLMPTAPVIGRLAEALDVDPGELFKEPVLAAGKAEAPTSGPATGLAEVGAEKRVRELIVSLPYTHEMQAEAFRMALNRLVIARDDYAAALEEGSRVVLRDDGERIEIFLEAPSSGASA